MGEGIKFIGQFLLVPFPLIRHSSILLDQALTQYPNSAWLLWAKGNFHHMVVASTLRLMLIAWIKNAITVQCSHIVRYVFCLCLVNLSMEKGLLMVVRGEANFEIHRRGPSFASSLLFTRRQGAVGDLPPSPRFGYQLIRPDHPRP